MLRTRSYWIPLFALFLAFNALGESIQVECKEPFAGMGQQFFLQETLDCSAAINRMNLLIKNSTAYSASGAATYSLSPECVDNSKVLDLVSGTGHIVNWSEMIKGNENIFKINLTCKSETIAILDTRRQTLKANDGKELVVSFQVFANDAAQTLIAYALESEDGAKQFTLRSPDGSVLVSASKEYSQTGAGCFATWSVSNSGLNPTVAAYVLAWKDNGQFDCSTLAAHSSHSATPTSEIVLYSLMGGTVVGCSCLAALVWHYKVKIRHFIHQYQDKVSQ